ncbi:MAG: prepilin-type N-terminal cleavage/methylation domain-containing protein [Oscillospiraceae bacterium]|nr:prepilin-type N-terminal cleavage/methylation domain-containing protein [Oscillospiraceae bacterium]
MKRSLQKLNNQSGFSLTEMLVVLIILLLVTGVVAAGMPVAANAYTKVVDAGNAQVLLSTTMTALREELSTATDISVKEGTTELERYRSARYSVLAQLSIENDVIMLEYLRDDGSSLGTDSDSRAIRPLVSRAAATKNLYVIFDKILYSNGMFTVEGLRVIQKTGGPEPEHVIAEIEGETGTEPEPFLIRNLNAFEG